jgi:hypothetical protein
VCKTLLIIYKIADINTPTDNENQKRSFVVAVPSFRQLRLFFVFSLLINYHFHNSNHILT